MTYFLDLLPVILFFVTFRVAESDKAGAATFATEHFGALISGGVVAASEAPVLLATLVVIVATSLQILWLKATRRHVKATLWFSFGLVVILGSLTIWLHDENFIKWKPTILHWTFALALALGPLIWRKSLVKKVMGQQLRLPDRIWAKLDGAWVLFFAAMGALNLWVAYRFDTATWVNFKLFGATALIVVFMLVQGLYLSRHVIADAAEAEPETPRTPLESEAP